MVSLEPERYEMLLKPLQELECNTLFARSVLTGDVDGQVMVEDAQAPTAADETAKR